MLLKKSGRTPEERKVEEERLGKLRARVKLQKLVMDKRNQQEHESGIFSKMVNYVTGSSQVT